MLKILENETLTKKDNNVKGNKGSDDGSSMTV